MLGLASCGNLAQVPPEEAIQLALTQQLTNVQNEIAKDLGLSTTAPPNFKIDSLTVSRREKLDERTFPANGYPTDIYRVKGTVETTLMTTDGKRQQTGPFEVLLGTTPSDNDSDAAAAATADTEIWYLLPSSKAKV